MPSCYSCITVELSLTWQSYFPSLYPYSSLSNLIQICRGECPRVCHSYSYSELDASCMWLCSLLPFQTNPSTQKSTVVLSHIASQCTVPFIFAANCHICITEQLSILACFCRVCCDKVCKYGLSLCIIAKITKMMKHRHFLLMACFDLSNVKVKEEIEKLNKGCGIDIRATAFTASGLNERHQYLNRARLSSVLQTK